MGPAMLKEHNNDLSSVVELTEPDRVKLETEVCTAAQKKWLRNL